MAFFGVTESLVTFRGAAEASYHMGHHVEGSDHGILEYQVSA